MGKSQREKGCRGERLFRDMCREQGFAGAERMGQQMYQRGSEIADVVGLPGIHIECKFVEKLNVRKAMEQSTKDSEDEGLGNIPILAHKTSRQPFLITMRAADWFRIYKGYLQNRNAIL